LDCPDACSLLIDVTNGKGSRLRGNPAHPVTRGFLCGKVAQYLEREYHAERLLYPLRRVGAKGEGKFERISWDAALDLIASALERVSQEWGPEAILPYSYGGNMGYLNGSGMDRRFFHRLGASQLDRTICASAGTEGLIQALGARYGTEPEQFRRSRLIVAWGANILATSVHLWPFIVEARRNGARFYVIDPVRTKTAAAADKWYGIYPGSDLALALALMHVILDRGLLDEEYLREHATGLDELRRRAADYSPERAAELTGIPAGDIVDLAQEYATIGPAVIRLNYGVQRSDRGATAVRAISLLPALTGSYRAEGGGLCLSTSQAFAINSEALRRPDLQLRSPLGRPARMVNMSLLGSVLHDLEDPPVKALFVYNSNPAAVAPDSQAVQDGLRDDDLFTVVCEQFQSDTADYADVLLPVTTFLENTDLYFAYGHYYIQLARPALPAPGECKSNTDIFRLLAARMGLSDPELAATDDELIEDALSSDHPFLKGISLERLERERFVRLNLPEPFLPHANGAANASGKFDLAAPLDYQPPLESRRGDRNLAARYPLELVSSKAHHGLNSTFAHTCEVDNETSRLRMHADDAAPRGIADGDRVRVFNDRGSVFLRAQVNGGVRPGVVHAPSLRWPKKMPNHQGINVLTSQRLTDFGGGPTFFSCLVDVERCGD
jgi:anaerobic selenocysteine-containing dehydrogenase